MRKFLSVLNLVCVIFIFGCNCSVSEKKLQFSSNFIDKYWQGKKPLLNIGICKNTILLKT